jgi:hypothetical protein
MAFAIPSGAMKDSINSAIGSMAHSCYASWHLDARAEACSGRYLLT